VHALFKLPNDQGLSSLLRSDAPHPPVESLIRETAVPGLHILSAGPPSDEAGDLLYSPTLRTLIGQLRETYDMILVDTPPMLQMADARIAARLADAIILVARARKTKRESLVAARERFAEDHTPILGVVLNDWNPRRARKAPGDVPRPYYAIDRQYSSGPTYSADWYK
jgi:capsular exopolysaccharide synthesis family protein